MDGYIDGYSWKVIAQVVAGLTDHSLGWELSEKENEER